MSIVVACIRDSMERRRISGALGDQIICVDDADALLEFMDSTKPAAVVIELNDDNSLGAIGACRVRYPSLPIVGYCRLSPAAVHDIIAAVRVGLSEVSLQRYDDLLSRLRALLHASTLESACREARQYLLDELPPHFHAVAVECIRHATEGCVDEVASALRLRSRTLSRRLERCGLPTVGLLIAWSRLLIAAHLLQDRGTTVSSVAKQIGTSAVVFRGILKRRAGVTPRQLRGPDGLAALLVTFRAVMRRRSHIHRDKHINCVRERRMRIRMVRA